MLGWKVELVTFGSPRVGNGSFASLVKKLVPKNARFVNPGDPVPMWPPLAFKFSHVDKKYVLGQKNNSEPEPEKGYKPEKGTCCFCIPMDKPPGEKGHGTADYVTNLLVPMNVNKQEYPPGFNMNEEVTKKGEKQEKKYKLTITENNFTPTPPANEKMDRPDVEQVAQTL